MALWTLLWALKNAPALYCGPRLAREPFLLIKKVRFWCRWYSNLYLFLFGVLGWFAVGVLWQDRAIMLLHLVALAAMISGMMAG